MPAEPIASSERCLYDERARPLRTAQAFCMTTRNGLLLVEDDEELRDIFERRLARRGFAVTAVDGPQAALAAAAVQRFVTAVIDRSIAPPGGFALIESLRQSDEALRIVAMSGSPADTWVAEAERRGADVCLLKPFSLSELDDAVRATSNGQS